MATIVPVFSATSHPRLGGNGIIPAPHIKMQSGLERFYLDPSHERADRAGLLCSGEVVSPGVV
jgi:hypothetical protein